jgi:hypothetical protein
MIKILIKNKSELDNFYKDNRTALWEQTLEANSFPCIICWDYSSNKTIYPYDFNDNTYETIKAYMPWLIKK